MDLSSVKKYNDNHRYLLQVIDVFSKYLHSIPLRTKTGKEVSSALESILHDPKYTRPISRRPMWVRTDKGKEFLNTQFQTLLESEAIEFQIPTSNLRSWSASTESCAINCPDLSPIGTRIDI
jgi:hypothetical protein